MTLRTSTIRCFQGILSVAVVTAIACYLVWQNDYIDNVITTVGEPEQCPSLQGHVPSVKNVYGFDPEVRKALSCRFEERRRRLNRSCRATGPHIYIPGIDKNGTDGRRTVQDEFTICFLPKIGSKFWSRYLKNFKVVETRFLKAEDYQNNERIAFVRDPYSRLFSGYLDKFFKANPSYWKSIGPSVLHTARVNSSGDLNSKCGIDITFAEFVKYILKKYNTVQMDGHFKPLQHRCEFCNMEYHFIGKMETFLDDVIYVSDVVGLLKYNWTRKFLLQEGLNNGQEMKRDTSHIFEWGLKVLKYCGVSLQQALRLTWRRWQIQGFIETKFDFPFKRGDTITAKRFSELAVNAHRLSDSRMLSAAKMAALRQAYSTLSLKTKLRLREIFLPQFDMFDYEAMPSKVFGNYSKSDYNFDFLERQTIFTVV